LTFVVEFVDIALCANQHLTHTPAWREEERGLPIPVQCVGVRLSIYQQLDQVTATIEDSSVQA
jgi:hypothetical protein